MSSRSERRRMQSKFAVLKRTAALTLICVAAVYVLVQLGTAIKLSNMTPFERKMYEFGVERGAEDRRTKAHYGTSDFRVVLFVPTPVSFKNGRLWQEYYAAPIKDERGNFNAFKEGYLAGYKPGPYETTPPR